MAELLMEYSSKLNDNELSLVVDYIKDLLNKRKENHIDDSYQVRMDAKSNFYAIREDYKKNVGKELSLDEINEMIYGYK